MKRYISGMFLTLLLGGCSGREAVAYIESAQIALSGNRAPVFSKIDRVVQPGEYTIHMNGFSITTPLTKSSDFSPQIEDQRWDVIRSNKNSEIDFDLTGSHFHYSINIRYEDEKIDYDDEASAVERQDEAYMTKLYRKYNPNVKLKIRQYGKGRYNCIVKDDIEKNSVSVTKSRQYLCYIVNSDKTKYRYFNVVASFYTYTKGNPHIPSQYNFDDLINRTKPILDSLYIEDF